MAVRGEHPSTPAAGVSCSTLRTHDLVEGIWAQVMDKDRNPKWSPASPGAVNAYDLEAFFAPVDDDLTF
jgi:enoyl-CoA hydratase